MAARHVVATSAPTPHLIACGAFPLAGPRGYFGTVNRVELPGKVTEVARCEHRHRRLATARACADAMLRTMEVPDAR